MSILSKILGAKKAADEHRNASLSAAEPKSDEPKPYRHVPTHAASDSMNLGASISTPDLHKRIKEQNKRHSRIPLKRTGSESYLEHRSSIAAKRSTRDLSIYPAMQLENPKSSRPVTSSPLQGAVLLAPVQNPYTIQPPKSSKRGRSPSSSKAPSLTRSRSPLPESIAEEPLEASNQSLDSSLIPSRNPNSSSSDLSLPIQG